jgi:two-component sensor histidine kinase/sugar lactone lactonase YvrE
MFGNHKIILVWILCVFGFVAASAQSEYSLNKRFITQTDGLPDRNVIGGIQDKYNYLWFGLQSGLCYYDGIAFTYLQKRNHGLRGSSVLSLASDDSVGIIIQYISPGTSRDPDKIVDVVNIVTKEVKPFGDYYKNAPFKESDIERILYTKNKPIQFILKNNPKKIWVYTSQYGFKEKPLLGKQIDAKLPSLQHLSNIQRKKINDRLSSEFILTPDSSLISLGNTNNKVLFLPNKGYIIPFVEPLVGADFLCFLNFKGELLPLEAADNKELKFDEHRESIWSANSGYNNNYLSPYSNSEEAVIEMYNRDIVFYSAQTGFVKIFESEENIKVRSFFKDHLGSWWLSTNVGIYKLTATKKVFKNHVNRKNPRFSFNNSARGIYVDEDVSCFNLYDAPVIIMGNDTIMYKTEQNFAAVRVKDALWISEYSIHKFDLTKKTITYSQPSHHGEVWSIFPIDNNTLLLGCSAGLVKAHVNQGKITRCDYKTFPSPRFVYKIFKNSKHELVAVAENGIYILNLELEIIDFYSITALSKEKHLPCSGIQDVFEDKDGMYWIGSSQEGLFRWDRDLHEFQQFGIEHGFLSTMIYGILEDDYDNLWISTNYGLTRFNKITNHTITYTESDGIADNEFNRSSSFKDKFGRIYFGGMNGVTSFHPEELQAQKIEKQYNFVLTKIVHINSSEGIIEESPDFEKKEHTITLSNDIKHSTLYFSLLDFENRQHRYAYMVEGLHNDWNITNDPYVQLSNLPYGSYVLRIQAQLSSGDWYTQQISVSIEVPVPLYKRWWFIFIMVIIVFCIIAFIITLRTRSLRNKNINLEKIVSERTKELQLSLNEQKAMLQEIHHRVKNNLQFIEAIINMQINISKEEKNQHILQDINLRINAMTLVHEMLYVKESVETISVKEYLTELTKKQISIMTSNIVYKTEHHADIENISLNINHCLALGMITTELISNSVKHRSSFSSIPIISITFKRDTNSQRYLYIIRDNGPGLPENQKQSNGLGMRLIDIFVRQLKGKYTFKNDGGVVFTMEFSVIH